MASRQIAIRITIDNRDAINAAKAQAIAMQSLNEETEKHTHLQNGLTNSFIKGNLEARAISLAFESVAKSLQYISTEAIQFESNLTKIAVITDTGKASLASLEETVRSLALSTNQSQNEIAKTALEMAKMGFSGNQLEEALGGVVKLSRALDENLVKTGETVVSVLNAYGLAGSDANKITDELAYTVKASALNIESFGTAFAYVGGTAKAAGVSLTELQGAMDVLSNAGIKASTIGTQLRRIIADLADPSSKAGQVLHGQTIESLGLVGALEALKEKNIDLAGLTEIFGRTASSVSSILIRYAGIVKDMAQETEKAQGINDSMSQGMNTTLLSSLQGIKTAWADLGITISKSTGFVKDFADQTRLALDTISEAMSQADWVKKFREANPKATSDIINRGSLVRELLPLQYNDIIAESPEFNRWKAQQMQAQADAKDKENSLDILKSTFDKSFKLPVNFNPSTQLDLIKVDPTQTAMYMHIQKIWGTDKEGFDAVLKKAKEQFALKAEIANSEKFDDNSLKKKKKEAPDFDPMDVFDRLQDLQKNGDTYAEKFMKEYNAKRDRTTAKEERIAKRFDMTADVLYDWKKFNSEIEKTKRLLEHNMVAAAGFKVAVEGINGSFDILSRYFVEGLFSDKKDPFKHISDAFGDFAKKMAADLVALTAKILFFKVLITGLNLISPGAGSFGSALASASIPGMKFASGTDMIVRQPTAFIAGEAGAERVRVTPRAKMSESDSGGVSIIIQGDVHDYDKFQRKVKQAMASHKGAFV